MREKTIKVQEAGSGIIKALKKGGEGIKGMQQCSPISLHNRDGISFDTVMNKTRKMSHIKF